MNKNNSHPQLKVTNSFSELHKYGIITYRTDFSQLVFARAGGQQQECKLINLCCTPEKSEILTFQRLDTISYILRLEAPIEEGQVQIPDPPLSSQQQIILNEQPCVLKETT